MHTAGARNHDIYSATSLTPTRDIKHTDFTCFWECFLQLADKSPLAVGCSVCGRITSIACQYRWRRQSQV